MTQSNIELLPDELWFEVFAYMSVSDLYFSWRDLNTRINAILRSMHISVMIDRKRMDSIFQPFQTESLPWNSARSDNGKRLRKSDRLQSEACQKESRRIRSTANGLDFYQEALQYFASQIVHVHVNDQRWSTDLLPLINIRSLELVDCSEQQLKQLVHHHQLTRLSLPCKHSEYLVRECVFTTDRERRFPHLRSIGRILPFHISDEKLRSLSPNRTIEHLHLIVPSSDHPIDFLRYVPNLKTITVEYLDNESVYIWPCTITAKIRHPNNWRETFDQNKVFLLTIAESIVCLRIDFHGHCNFVELSKILHRCPNLNQLRVKVKYYPADIALASIRQLSPFFTALDFGHVEKETGKRNIAVKWSQR